MQQQISLQIVNIEVLERNTKPNCVFDLQGGSIGSSADDHWYLHDKSGYVQPEHALITVMDDQFCIQQNTAQVYVNQASYPLEQGELALLHDSDSIEIGKYKLRVHFAHENHFSTDLNASLEEVLDDEEETTLLVSNELGYREKPLVVENTDPELALAQAMVITNDDDPENYLKAQDTLNTERNSLSDLIEGDEIVSHSFAQPVTTDEYKRTQNKGNTIVSKGVQTVKNDFSSKMEDLEDLVMGKDGVAIADLGGNNNAGVGANRGGSEAEHLAASPLQRGLGFSFKQPDSKHTHLVLEEIGMTLKEAIEGLLKIHAAAQAQGQERKSKALQPIEDNPLRLNLDYTTTMSALFDSDRSKVHLAAPMAVKESLTQLLQHQMATEYATNKALDSILQALNPNTLSARFKRYRGAHTKDEESSEGWAWEMYKHYYQELISSRQQGFEKLYAEVFEQAYDLRLRELQRQESEYD